MQKPYRIMNNYSIGGRMTGSDPTHGYTKEGHAVHGRVHDHMSTGSFYARFNKRVATTINKYVMTMTAFWIFNFISLMSLPAVMTLVMPSTSHLFPAWLIKASLVSLVAWVSSNWLQLVFLPALGVGQNLQNLAADVRNTKMFEDMEVVVDKVDEHTDGGIKVIVDRLDAIESLIKGEKL